MAHTKEKTLSENDVWVLPMNTSVRDFEATLVAYKLSGTSPLEVKATITPFAKIINTNGDGGVWFDFVDADKLTAFNDANDNVQLVENIAKPITALKFSVGTGGSPIGLVTVQVLQTCF
jgi:hypothetical protein